MSKRIFFWVFPLMLIVIMVLLSIEESRTFVLALFLRVFLFAKQHVMVLLTAFFLVNGKFIFTLFLKKIALLSATGLGKRYLIEKVITHNLKVHFLDDLSDAIRRLVLHIKKNFKDFPLIKQVIAGLAFLGSLGFVGKFMGSMLAVKVFVAKFWSFLLALFLKLGTGVIYFFTDYLWGSWLAPVVEVFIISWVLRWLEKVPFLKTFFMKMYDVFVGFYTWAEFYLEKVFHIPMKRILRFISRKIKKFIYRFIDYIKVSAWKRLQEVRELRPSHYVKLQNKRALHLNSRAKLVKKREQKHKKVS